MLKKFLTQLKKSFIDTAPDPLDALSLNELIKLNIPAKQIDLHNKKLVATSLAGDKLAQFRGRGMDFDESRIYQSGDDVRLIDWRVTARSGTTHTKIYREERERPVYSLVDFTESMWFGSQTNFKAVIAAQAASILAWAACEHGDRIGGVVCSEVKTWSLKPAAGKRGVLQLLNLLSEQRPNIAEDSDPELFAKSLLQLRHVAKPGSLIFLFTDGKNLTKTAEQYLAQLSKHCDVILGFCYDKLEMQLPATGIYSFSNGHDKITFDTADKKLCDAYQQQFTARFDELKTLTNRYRIPLFMLPTSVPAIKTMQQVFSLKKTKVGELQES